MDVVRLTPYGVDPSQASHPMRNSPTTVLRPYVLVRADANTDAIAAIMNVVGREYRVGRVRSRPSTRLRPSGLQQSTH
jgi:hypothetical protein